MMIEKQTPQKSFPQTLLHWSINLVWTLVWIVLYIMCVNSFGNSVSFIGIPVLLVLMSLVWYSMERRNTSTRKETE